MGRDHSLIFEMKSTHIKVKCEYVTTVFVYNMFIYCMVYVHVCSAHTHTAVRPHHVTGTKTQTETSDVTEQIPTQTLKLFLNFTSWVLSCLNP